MFVSLGSLSNARGDAIKSTLIGATMKEIRHFHTFLMEKPFNYIYGFEVNELTNWWLKGQYIVYEPV